MRKIRSPERVGGIGFGRRAAHCRRWWMPMMPKEYDKKQGSKGNGGELSQKVRAGWNIEVHGVKAG